MGRELIGGAKWWKFDFHNHTPASHDYGRALKELKGITPRDWLLNFMKKEIDCVAITDHNTGSWIDILKNELHQMEVEQPKGFRPLWLFPGVEISVNGGIHLLAIFDTTATSEAVSGLLGAVKFLGTYGETSDCTTTTVSEVITEVVSRRGIAIPAHVDIESGLFTMQGSSGQGPTLTQSLSAEGLIALEIRDIGYQKPQIYSELKLHLAEVVGSDSHKPEDVGNRFTWVKMQRPSFDGLFLALHDESDGIRHCQLISNNPNDTGGRFFLKRITLTKGQRAGLGHPLSVEFSPWLTSIIGGRGSGKSSVLDYLRIILNQVEGLPEKIKKDFKEFAQIPVTRDKPGMLRSDTEIRLEMIKDGRGMALVWKANNWSEEQKNDSGVWEHRGSPGNVIERFPVRIYSQKQLYEMTEDPYVLLNLIDSKIDKVTWQDQRDGLQTEWLDSKRIERELRKQLSTEEDIIAETRDIDAKIMMFEESEHKQVLEDYQANQILNKNFNDKNDALDLFVSVLKEAFILAPDVSMDEDTRIQVGAVSLDVINEETTNWQAVITILQDAIEKTALSVTAWKEHTDLLPWKVKLKESIVRYEELVEKLKEAGQEDPNGYSDLVKKKRNLDEKISGMQKMRLDLSSQEEKSHLIIKEIIKCEKDLRVMRKRVIAKWNHPDFQREIRVEMEEMGNDRHAEETFRKIIRKSGNEYARDICERDENGNLGSGFLFNLVSKEDPEERWRYREEYLTKLTDIPVDNPNELSKPFIRHVDALSHSTPEDLDKLLVWVPEDRIILKLLKDGRLEDIEVGSAGQRTAGMLSLLLALNDCPLIIDQPEDDLDTSHISNLVVAGLRLLKTKQQVIVVTHNPNIPVNGGAEQIVVMNFANGQICVRRVGALQERTIRNDVCEIMEGGQKALENRYFRISKALQRAPGTV
ncbi:MAG TPA: PHP-associated domain-containing protein [Desulfosporosinus sp.]|nr:PHP-associated domain-containing protein [Desulfosporosinus sp.]